MEVNITGKETKVILSVDEFDKYRTMERAIKERKIYRIWEDTGGYGQMTRFSVIDENEVIQELTDRIDKLNKDNFEMKKVIAEYNIRKIMSK